MPHSLMNVHLVLHILAAIKELKEDLTIIKEMTEELAVIKELKEDINLIKEMTEELAVIKDLKEDVMTVEEHVGTIAAKVEEMDHITEQVDNIAGYTYVPAAYRKGRVICRIKLFSIAGLLYHNLCKLGP